MILKFLKSKLHRATVTQSNLNYEGSITIDSELMEMSDINEFEMVQVVNINNGVRFETYAIRGESGSRIIGLNGAAARLGMEGDKVIIMTYCDLHSDEIKSHKPKIIVLDDDNNFKKEISR
ncbi:MAG: aspartate 1-decarboxylase [Candidatus Marinimicrobia bacterium]|nr:aspartate 1-decarboxylase [Candidatus Neomarinimicrobiota bacterium]